MNDSPQSGFSLELSRHFNAAPERVFDAWLGEEWGEWLPPNASRCRVTLLERAPAAAII